jgi:hypothetical protein
VLGLANVVFQDIQICIYDADGKEQAQKLDKYFEFGDAHDDDDNDDGSISTANSEFDAGMTTSTLLVDAKQTIGSNRSAKYRASTNRHNRENSEVGTETSTMLADAKNSLKMRESVRYGALKARPTARQRQLERDMSSRMNPDQQIMQSGLLQHGAMLGTDDQPRDGEKEQEMETHPLLA